MPEAGTQLDTDAIFKFFNIVWKINSLVSKVILTLKYLNFLFRRAHFLLLWRKPQSFSGLSTVKPFLEESIFSWCHWCFKEGSQVSNPALDFSEMLIFHGFSVVVQHLSQEAIETYSVCVNLMCYLFICLHKSKPLALNLSVVQGKPLCFSGSLTGHFL